MRKGKDKNDPMSTRIEKKIILDMLKENDCQTIEELKNLVLFLNNENKRLHISHIVIMIIMEYHYIQKKICYLMKTI